MGIRARKKTKRFVRFGPRLPDDYSLAFPRASVLAALAVAFVVQIGFLGYQATNKDGHANVAAVLPGAITLFTNEARAENATAPLVEDALLTEAAQRKAEDMAAKSYFSHREPHGEMSWYRFKDAGYEYVYAGENLAVNFFDTRELVDAWLASPTHRANIIKPNYDDIGIGMATGTYKGREAIFVVQFFGSRHYTPPAEPVALEQTSSAAASFGGRTDFGGELPAEPAAAVSPSAR